MSNNKDCASASLIQNASFKCHALAGRKQPWHGIVQGVRTENLIRVDDVMESPKLAE
jgi:hypothetical protein